MNVYKIIWITLGICLPCIALLEFINRWHKYRVRVTKELFRLDQLTQACPTEDLEKVWAEVCAFNDKAAMTNTQMMKMLSVLAHMQGRRAQYRNDVAATSPTFVQSIRLYEELREATMSLGLPIWSCCQDGRHSPAEPSCIPGRHVVQVLEKLKRNESAVGKNPS